LQSECGALEKEFNGLGGANEDQTVGVRLLAEAIEEPLPHIVENAGEDEAGHAHGPAGGGWVGWI
jgi:chaperonin GroEL (HSP60 family)